MAESKEELKSLLMNVKEESKKANLKLNIQKLKSWPPDAKNWLIGKGPDAEKDWRQEDEEMTEDEMVGWHHWVDERKFE